MVVSRALVRDDISLVKQCSKHEGNEVNRQKVELVINPCERKGIFYWRRAEKTDDPLRST